MNYLTDDLTNKDEPEENFAELIWLGVLLGIALILLFG